MNKIDDSTIEKLITLVQSFDKKLTNWEDSYSIHSHLQSDNTRLANEIADLKKQLASVEYRTRVERAAELDRQEHSLKAQQKIEYDKGYADAYIEVTKKMGKQ